jgi:hypothetical protein
MVKIKKKGGEKKMKTLCETKKFPIRLWNIAEKLKKMRGEIAQVSRIEEKEMIVHERLVNAILRSTYRSVSIPQLFTFGYFVTQIDSLLEFKQIYPPERCIICKEMTNDCVGMINSRYLPLCDKHFNMGKHAYALSIFIPTQEPIKIRTPYAVQTLRIHVAASKEMWQRIVPKDPLVGVVYLNRFFITKFVQPTKLDRIIAALAE